MEQWSSNLSLYIVDTSTILLLGFWSINTSIIELSKIYFAITTNDLNLSKIDSLSVDDFKTRFNLDKIIASVIGKIEGSVSNKVRGKNGFGYDPIFIPKKKKQTFGEMKFSSKCKIDHRSIAFKKIKKFL